MQILAASQMRISRLAALAILALCLVQTQARAQEEIRFVFHTIPWGMVRGQTARLSVFNPGEQTIPERLRRVFVQVSLLDANDEVIATSDEMRIPAGEFRSVDFNHDDLPVAGEPGSGRVQTRARVRYRFFQLVDRTRTVSSPSIELIDAATGHTTVSQKPKEIVVVGTNSPSPPAVTELPIIVYSSRALIGLTQGHTLRLNVVYPVELAGPQRQQSGPVLARVRLYSGSGALLAQSVEATITPGRFHSFDFDRADLPSGEPVGGRLQMQVRIEVMPIDPFTFTRDPRGTGLLPPSLELVDITTGKTAVWVTTGFFEVVPPLPQ